MPDAGSGPHEVLLTGSVSPGDLQDAGDDAGDLQASANSSSSAGSVAGDGRVQKFRRKRRHKMEEIEAAWMQYDPRAGGKPTFFNNLRISRDGGFSTIPALYNPLRYLWAGIAVVMIAVNVRALFVADLPALVNNDWACSMSTHSAFDLCSKSETQQFLVTDIILNKAIFWTDVRLDPEVTVALLDLTLLFLVALRGVYLLVRGVCFSKSAVRRWDSIADFFQIVVPELGIISSMMFLYFVSPAVLTPHLSHRIQRLLDAKAHRKWAILDLVGFAISRLLALLVGFDAFLIKFSTTATIYLDTSTGGTPQGSFAAMIMLAAFLNQILGVVNVTWFVKRRLFIFIFGGEDGYMSEEEELRKRLWNAMLVREVWLRYNDRHKCMHIFKFSVIMLSFCDYDFQRMCLKEYGGLPKDANTGIGPSFAGEEP